MAKVMLSESFRETLLHDVQTLLGNEIEPLGVEIGAQIIFVHGAGIIG